MPHLINSVEALEGPGGPFHNLLDLASDLFNVPTVVVSLLTPDEAVIRANTDLGVRRVKRTKSLAHRVAMDGPGALWIVDDVRFDPRMAGLPIAAHQSEFRFCAAVTLVGPDRKPVGTLSVIDTRSGRPFGAEEQNRLHLVGKLAEDIIAGLDQGRRSDERLETLKLVEQMAKVGHWRYDRLVQTLEWSDEVYAIHGVAPGLPISLQQWSNLYVGQDADKLSALIEGALASGNGYRAQLSLRRSDDSLRQLLTLAAAECDENGEVTALFGVVQDVTEQQELLERVRRDESRYRLLADNIDDVITRVKSDGSSRYISPAIRSLLGWTRQEMSGSALDYVHPDDRVAVRRALKAVIKTGASARLEHRALHRDGSTRWVECAFKAVQGEGNDGDVIVVIRDIDARKRLEGEVADARDRAEAAARAKSEFLANMSHELRTPLTSVVGFAGLLLGSDRLLDTERGYVKRIATASDALLAVINDILDYTKLDAGAIELDPTPFDPRDIVREAAVLLESQCALKTLSLSLELDEGLPEALLGDVGRIRQVLLNFLSNAVKFTAQGGIWVRARAVPSAGGRWRMRAEVSDSGIGIAPDKIHQIFDRFSQADASTTRLYGGTGLGLAISRRLIEMMGGAVGVDSRVGEGSTFWFELDLPEADPESLRAEAADATVALTGRVLVADDAAPNRELFRVILESLGLEVEAVCDGAEALRALQSASYDLVLMDVQMPVLDGLAATREIRRVEADRAHRTAVVALTANTQQDQIALCLKAGMDGHLAKPLEVPTLIKVLGEHLPASGRADRPMAQAG